MTKVKPISFLALNADELELSMLLNLDVLELQSSRLETLDDIDQLEEGDNLIILSSTLDTKLLELLKHLHELSSLAIVLVTSEYDPELYFKAMQLGAGACVCLQDRTINPTNLSIALVSSQHNWLVANNLKVEIEEYKTRLGNRKLVERAKGVLMQTRRISEDEAYTQMRKTAMNQGKSMAVLAQQILSVSDVLEAKEA